MYSFFFLVFHLAVSCRASCYGFTNSTQCLEHLKEEKLEEIKKRFLDVLGISEEFARDVPQIMKNGFESIIEDIEKNEFHYSEDDHEKTFIVAVDPFYGRDRSTLVAHFPVSRATKYKHILKVILNVYLRVDVTLENDVEINVTVRERMPNLLLGEEIASKRIMIKKSGKIHIPLQPSDVKRWWSRGKTLGLLAEAMLDGQNIAIHPQMTDNPGEMMFLTLDMQLSSMIRHRRHLNPICNSQITHEGCCLYDLFVDFKSFGWEFIVAPLRYNAYICRGDCAMNNSAQPNRAYSYRSDWRCRITE